MQRKVSLEWTLGLGTLTGRTCHSSGESADMKTTLLSSNCGLMDSNQLGSGGKCAEAAPRRILVKTRQAPNSTDVKIEPDWRIAVVMVVTKAILEDVKLLSHQFSHQHHHHSRRELFLIISNYCRNSLPVVGLFRLAIDKIKHNKHSQSPVFQSISSVTNVKFMRARHDGGHSLSPFIPHATLWPDQSLGHHPIKTELRTRN